LQLLKIDEVCDEEKKGTTEKFLLLPSQAGGGIGILSNLFRGAGCSSRHGCSQQA
jgi:hypothetical protein